MELVLHSLFCFLREYDFIIFSQNTNLFSNGVSYPVNPLAHQARLYLDTSVFSFLFADDAPEKKAITEAFFEEFQAS